MVDLQLLWRRYPAVADFVANWASHRFETEEGDLFELLWRRAQRWTPDSEPAVELEDLADELGALAFDERHSPDELESLFHGGAQSGFRMVVGAASRPVLSLLSAHLTFLLLCSDGAPDTGSEAIPLPFGESVSSAENALARLYSAMHAADSSTRDTALLELLRRGNQGRLSAEPWQHFGEPVWSEESARAFTRAVVSYIYAVYTYAPTLHGRCLRIPDDVWQELDAGLLSKTISALHFARFVLPNSLGSLNPCTHLIGSYQRAVTLLGNLHASHGRDEKSKRTAHMLCLNSASDWKGRPQADAIEFAVRIYSTAEAIPKPESAKLAMLGDLVAPFSLSQTAALELLKLASKARHQARSS